MLVDLAGLSLPTDFAGLLDIFIVFCRFLQILHCFPDSCKGQVSDLVQSLGSDLSSPLPIPHGAQEAE